jgi:hypothetical protein
MLLTAPGAAATSGQDFSGNCQGMSDPAGREGLCTSSPFVKSHADVAPGFVYQINGTFYVNATPIRFWGVNTGWGGDWKRGGDSHQALTHSDIDSFVNRLQASGFNAVRVFPPSSFLFGDLRTGKDREYVKGDGSLTEKFDYFLYRLKQAGMYVHMSLNVHGPNFREMNPLFQGPAEEFDEWKTANQQYGWPAVIDQAFVVDKSWEHIKIQNALRVLKHYNQWTGKHYFEDEVFALYEMNNEVRFPERVLSGEIDKPVTGKKRGGMPEYFKRQFQAHWNGYLLKKYGGDSGLPDGYLTAQESLAKGTVKLAPAQGEAGYTVERARDFAEFVLERHIEVYERLFAAIRATAPKGVGASVVPLNVDSISSTGDSVANAYVTARGGYNSGNAYQHHHYTLRNDAAHPNYPYVSMLSLPPEPHGYSREEYHQKRSNMEIGRIRGQPFVMYEGMSMTPNIFKAEYFIYHSVLGSWQNHGGYFFYSYSIRRHAEDEKWYRGPLLYSKDDQWTSSDGFGRDEVLASVAWAAGAAFRHFGIQAAKNPTTFLFGRDAIFNPDWVGHGSGADDWQKTARTAIKYGAELAFQPAAPFGKQIKGPVQDGDFKEAVASGDEILWDWPNGRLIVDTPYAKIYAGVFPRDRRLTFKDGVKVENLSRPWGYFILASDTRDPIATSDRVFLSLMQTSDNTGFRIEPSKVSTDVTSVVGWRRAILNEGSLPVVVNRLSGDVTLPERPERKLLKRDFDLNQIGSLVTAAKGIHISEDEPIFQWILLAGEELKLQK